LTDKEYLERVTAIRDAVVHRKDEELPSALRSDPDAAALFGVLRAELSSHQAVPAELDSLASDAAQAVWGIVRRNLKVGYWDDPDAQKQTMNDIDDYLYDDLRGKRGISLSPGEMDLIIEKTMTLARHRLGG
jgi:type I restriction enzyme R subunit